MLWWKCVLRHQTLQKTTAKYQTLHCCHDYLLAKQLHIDYNNQDLKREKTMVSFPGMLIQKWTNDWWFVGYILLSGW